MASGVDMAIGTSTLDEPGRYGRVIRDRSGVSMIKEYVDLSQEEKAIQEINAGIYLFSREVLKTFLSKVLPHPEKKERFLTTIVELVRQAGGEVGGVVLSPDVVLGVNTQEELSYAAGLLKNRINKKHMASGVTFWDPASTYVGPRVRIGPGTILFPGVILEGDVVLSERTHVGAGCHLTDVHSGPDVTIRDYCVISGSRIEAAAVIGPFAHIRPDSHVGPTAHVGNFVELKKTSLGEGAKANHLAYLGDAEIGAGSNIGAGTITCNYDGVGKHKTVLGKNVFVGSDTQFVAPLKVGDGAVIAAGSTITEDIPPDSLALSRTSQENRDGAAIRYREKLLAAKRGHQVAPGGQGG
jgi:bifunctional UDP-N-acetylglucosamine pyrophosphorylase/glucosamine-1-phosphate N-acetyltransferase